MARAATATIPQSPEAHPLITKAALRGATPAPGTRGYFRLGDLVFTEKNTRDPKTRTPQKVYGMAMSMHHQGVLQNLLLIPVLDAQGRWTGQLGAAGGETRRQALCLLRDGGVPDATGYSDDYPVPGLVIPDAEATAASLTENYERASMHPADEFVAFKELVDQCGSVDHVAAMFGREPVYVERVLRLANAAPALFLLYREGGIELDQLMALCLVDDHEKQEAVWRNAQKPWQRDPAELRQAITKGKIDFRTDKLARFVGLKDYEGAGGTVLRDLFSGEDSGYATDLQLLQRLAADKLEQAAARVREEGWAEVIVGLQLTAADLHAYEPCSVYKCELTAEQAQQMEELQRHRKDTEKRLRARGVDEAQRVALEAQLDDVIRELNHLEAARVRPAEASRGFACAFVYLDHAGRLCVDRGRAPRHQVRAAEKARQKQQRDQQRQSQLGAGDAQPAAEPDDDGAGQELSQNMKLRLSAHRTLALQAVLACDVGLALVALALPLVRKVFSKGHSSFGALRAFSVSTPVSSLLQVEPALGDTKAARELGGMQHDWAARMPDDNRQLLGWLRTLPQDELLELIAICTASCVNTIGTALDDDGAALASAGGLDMADWWEPTEDYFKATPRAHILAAVREAVSDAEAVALQRLKKGEMAAQAAAKLAGRRWVPPDLRLDTGAQEGVAAERGAA